ncbi:MAG: hypothetical protein ACLT2F_06085 [Butyricicoccus sp.]
MYPRSAAENPRKDSAGFYTLKGKVSVWNFDDFGTAYGPFLLVGKHSFATPVTVERRSFFMPVPYANRAKRYANTKARMRMQGGITMKEHYKVSAMLRSTP